MSHPSFSQCSHRTIRILLLLTVFLGSIQLNAQEKMFFHLTSHSTLGAPVGSTDSIWFSSDSTTAFFQIGDTIVQHLLTEIDSITFGALSDTVFIDYNGSWFSVINPYAFEGLDVVVSGADAIVTSANDTLDVVYCLSGSSSNGMFKLYSETPYTLVLNGVNLTNSDGPAINIQSKKTGEIVLIAGTSNTLTDGAVYADPPSGEDQKGAFFSEGALEFSESGALTINGMGDDQHALCSDKAITVSSGFIEVTSATKDAIHAKSGLNHTGGNLTLTASGDGIDGDEGEITISGGTVDIEVPGDACKGIKTDMAINLNGGTVNILNSGDAVLEASGSGYDPSYCTAVKSDDDIVVNGANVTIESTGLAGKGFSADGEIIILSGTLTFTNAGNGATYVNTSGVLDAYTATCLTADGNIRIEGGNLITSSSGSAGKGISTDMELFIGTSSSVPEIQVTTTGTRIYISGSGNNAEYAEAKAIKSDSSAHIINGNITIASADDGIKSEYLIEIDNATLTITNSVEGLEAPFININSGTVEIKSSDDCINTTFGLGGELDDGSLLQITGGLISLNTTGGDGIDSNGDILFTGGTTIVHGPPNQPEVGMDFNGECNVNGGFLVISAPNSNMLQAPDATSAQYCVMAKTPQGLSSSTLFHLQDASANALLTFQPVRTYYSIIFSSDNLQNGGNYSIYTGGTYTGGTNNHGMHTGGVYSGGTFKKSFTINSKITQVTF